MVAILLVLLISERKKKDELADKLYDLGMASVRKDTEVHTTLQAVQRDVEEIRRTYK